MSGRMTIRLATGDDAATIRDIYAPSCEHTAVSFEAEAPTVGEVEQRIRGTVGRLPWLVCEDVGEMVGYAYASRHRERAAYRWSVDVSVYVRDGRQRSGVGRALYTSLLQALVLQGYYNAYAGITLPNPASVGLHEAVGFRPLGVYRGVGYKLGTWHDVGWWHRALRPPSPAPTEPSPLAELRGTADWEAALSAGLPHLRSPADA